MATKSVTGREKFVAFNNAVSYHVIPCNIYIAPKPLPVASLIANNFNCPHNTIEAQLSEEFFRCVGTNFSRVNYINFRVLETARPVVWLVDPCKRVETQEIWRIRRQKYQQALLISHEKLDVYE